MERNRSSRKLKKPETTTLASDGPESSSSHLLDSQSQTLPLHLQAQVQEHEEAPVQEQEEEEEEEEVLDPEVYLDLQERKAWQTQRSLRIAIALIYQTVLQAPPEEDFDGPDGTVDLIYKRLMGIDGEPTTTRQHIKNIIVDVSRKNNNNLPYLGERKLRATEYFIENDSLEMQIIADLMEDSLGLQMTTEIFNQHLEENGCERRVSKSTVYRAFLRLQPFVTPIKKRPQGNYSRESVWARARLEWVTQLLVRFGILGVDRLEQIYGAGMIPDKFNPENLGPRLAITQIVFWDETHKKVVVGKSGTRRGNTNVECRFKRNENGKLDPNGTYAEPKSLLKMKYAEEVRLCLGVAQVEREDGVIEGRRAMPFDYSGKVVLSIKDWNKKEKEEILRVKNLQGNALPWVETQHEEAGMFHGNDRVTKIQNIGKKTAERLATINALTVRQLLDADIDELMTMYSRAKVDRWREDASHVLPGDAPPIVVTNHKLAANPYESRYGPEWRDDIAKSCFMTKYVCITSLVQHVYDESKALMVGTKHEDDWLFYHDALSLMTAKDCIAWMKDKNIHAIWLLPMLDCNAGTPYEGKPVGNSPELMPLDNSLNQDLHESVRQHVALTQSLDNDDVNKFDISTPRRGSRAYHRVWNSPEAEGAIGSAVSSRRIVQDTNKVLQALFIIRDNNGAAVEGLASRQGHRDMKTVAVQAGTTVLPARTTKETWVHPTAAGTKGVMLLESLRRFYDEKEDDTSSSDGSDNEH